MAANSKANHSVLFVCWGNICRSPIAEAIFKNLVKEKGISDRWTVDSAGTGEWNVGDLPDPRALKTLKSVVSGFERLYILLAYRLINLLVA